MLTEIISPIIRHQNIWRNSMTREDYIKSLIKAQGYTLKAFAQEINMPYTTLLSILNGSIGGAAMDNVLKICHALRIHMEELERISEAMTSAAASSSGPAEEVDEPLLKLIRQLPMDKKLALKILLSEL